jgi:hypothetical protein
VIQPRRKELGAAFDRHRVVVLRSSAVGSKNAPVPCVFKCGFDVSECMPFDDHKCSDIWRHGF